MINLSDKPKILFLDCLNQSINGEAEHILSTLEEAMEQIDPHMASEYLVELPEIYYFKPCDVKGLAEKRIQRMAADNNLPLYYIGRGIAAPEALEAIKAVQFHPQTLGVFFLNDEKESKLNVLAENLGKIVSIAEAIAVPVIGICSIISLVRRLRK